MKNTTRTRRVAVCFSALFLIGAASGAIAAAPPDETFRDLILQRLRAYSSGDSAGYRRLLADDFVHVDDSGKRRTVPELVAYTSVGNSSRWELSDLHVRMLTDSLAVVDCQSMDISTNGSREIRRPLHEMDVFVLRDGRWLFLEHTETHVFASPKTITPDPALLDDYVGEYEFWPGHRDIITRKGDQLFGQEPDDKEATPLVAATNETFFVGGDSEIGVFIRDVNGKVVQEIVHSPDGQLFVARKVK